MLFVQLVSVNTLVSAALDNPYTTVQAGDVCYFNARDNTSTTQGTFSGGMGRVPASEL